MTNVKRVIKREKKNEKDLLRERIDELAEIEIGKIAKVKEIEQHARKTGKKASREKGQFRDRSVEINNNGKWEYVELRNETDLFDAYDRGGEYLKRNMTLDEAKKFIDERYG